MTEQNTALEQSKLTHSIESARLSHERGMEADRLSHMRKMEVHRLTADIKNQRVSTGLVSVIFGTGAEKSSNVAGLALVIMSLMIAGIMIFDPASPITAPCFSVLTLALGYLFGRAGVEGSNSQKDSPTN
jgi:hypothetical protein